MRMGAGLELVKEAETTRGKITAKNHLKRAALKIPSPRTQTKSCNLQ